jgi:hypothetical protein
MEKCQKVIIKRGACCMSCGLPQKAFGEHIHGNVYSGECEYGLRDIMKGICWKIFREDGLREKYIPEFGKGEEDRFKGWLFEMDISGEMINGCRMMLNVWRERII